MSKAYKNINKVVSKTGFTLVELLVVMAILGILIAVAIAGIGLAQRGARDNTRVRDVGTTLLGIVEQAYSYTNPKKYPLTTDFTISGQDVSINVGSSSIKAVMQQPGVSGTTVTSITLTCTGGTCSDNCDTALATTDSNSWAIGYGTTTSRSTYILCFKTEAGPVQRYSPAQ